MYTYVIQYYSKILINYNNRVTGPSRDIHSFEITDQQQ